MSCSICGSQEHNARKCPYKDGEAPRDYALWMKFDNMTEKEAADLQARIIRDKSRIAPKARGTSAKGPAKELPGRIQDALKLLGGKRPAKLPGGKDGTKKKQ